MIKQILKRVKPKTIILLIILLMFNSYAWFVYQSKVWGQLTTRVEAWTIIFKAGDNPDSVSSVVLDIATIFPGYEMEDYEIKVFNEGEKPAKVTYKIIEITILEETYRYDDDLQSLGYNDLSELIADPKYPFRLTIDIGKDVLDAGYDTTSIVIRLKWPFERGDTPEEIAIEDKLDTDWGEWAAEFNKTNPGEPSIRIEIELIASQFIE